MALCGWCRLLLLCGAFCCLERFLDRASWSIALSRMVRKLDLIEDAELFDPRGAGHIVASDMAKALDPVVAEKSIVLS